MYRNASSKNLAILGEFRKIAESLFPQGSKPSGIIPSKQKPDLAAAAGFAQALGIDTEYRRLLKVNKNTAEMKEFLVHFQNNLDLLIQKTWVEKADESRRDKLQDEVSPFMTMIIEEQYPQAIEAFGAILEELAYLFFGVQSAKDDFTEYALRIDMQMGLFWWYGTQLGRLYKKDKAAVYNDEYLWAVLLIGICYLTNF
ncbi:MAG: hypothetical protein FWG89_00420 [Treponema sp.]|nr:hypothetical protein [Treponema sp.]